MALPQQKFREMVFQLLYSRDLGQTDDEEMGKLLMKELQVSKKNVRAAHERMEKILPHLPIIDACLTEISQAYDFNRIQTVERNVLRLAAYELLYDTEIPPKVAIAESIRLTRKFGTPEGANFVNALLDALYKKQQGDQADAETLQATAEQLKTSEATSLKVSELIEKEKEQS